MEIRLGSESRNKNSSENRRSLRIVGAGRCGLFIWIRRSNGAQPMERTGDFIDVGGIGVKEEIALFILYRRIFDNHHILGRGDSRQRVQSAPIRALRDRHSVDLFRHDVRLPLADIHRRRHEPLFGQISGFHKSVVAFERSRVAC